MGDKKKIGELAIEASLELDKLKADGAQGTSTLQKLLDAALKLDKGLTPTEKSIKRAADTLERLSATKAQQRMNELAAGVDKAGAAFTKNAAQVAYLRQQIERLQAAGAKVPATLAKLDLSPKFGQVLGKATLSELSSQAATLTSKLGPLGGVLTGLGPAGLAAGAGLAIVAGEAAAVTYVAKTLVDSMIEASHWASEISDTATAIGATTEETQRLQHVATAAGKDFSVLRQGIRHLRDVLANNPDAFRRLGLDVDRLRQMNAPDLFFTVGRAVESLGEKNERTAISADIFGQSYSELAPIISAGSEKMRDAVVVQDDVVQRLADQDTQINLLKESWEGLWRSIGAAASTSGVTDFLGKLTGALNHLSQFMQEHPQIVTLGVQAMAAGVTFGMSNVVLEGVKLLGGDTPAAGGSGSAAAPGAPGGGGLDHLLPSDEQRKKMRGVVDSIAASVDKATLSPIYQEIAAIGRSRDAKIADELASKDNILVKARMIKLYQEEAAAAIEAAKAADFLALQTKAVVAIGDMAAQKRELYDQATQAFGADDAELASRLGTLMDNVERVQHGFGNMNAGQIEAFRSQLSALANAGGEVLPEVFDALAKSGEHLKADLFETGDAIEATGGKWMRAGVAAEDSAVQQSLAVKKITDALDDQIEDLEIAAYDAQSLSNILGGLSGIAGNLGTKFGSNLLGGGQGLFGAISGLRDIKAKKLAGKASGLDEIAGTIGVVGAGISIGMTVLSGLKSVFGKSESEKIGEDLGRKIGKAIPDSIAKAIEESEKTGGKNGGKISRALAEALHAGDILEAAGLNAGSASLIGDLFLAYAQGAVDSKEAVDQLSKAFTQLKTAAAGGDVEAQTAMRGMVHRAKELQLSIPEIDSALKEWADDARANLKDLFGGQNAKFTGKGDEKTLLGQAVSSAQAAANQTIFNAVMGLSGSKDIVEMVEDGKDAFEALKKSLPPGTALTGLAGDFDKISHALENPLFKGAAQSARAGGKILGDIINSDALNQQTVDAFGTTLKTGLDEALAGTDSKLPPDERRRLAEEANLPLLIQMQHAEAAGAHLSDETKAELEQARKDGLLPMLSTAEQSLQVQKDILAAIRGDVAKPRGGGERGGAPSSPAAGHAGEHGFTGIPEHPTGPPPTHHADGGWTGIDGPELTWTGERGPELIVPHEVLAAANYDIPRAGAGTMPTARSGGKLGGSSTRVDARSTVAITIHAQPHQSPRDIANAVAAAIEDRLSPRLARVLKG